MKTNTLEMFSKKDKKEQKIKEQTKEEAKITTSKVHKVLLQFKNFV